MYGLLLEGMADYIRREHGEDKWKLIRQRANLTEESFSTHQMYNDKIVQQISAACQDVLGIPLEKIYDSFGAYFVNFIGQYGYDTMLKVLGRSLRDFLNGLDNLHEYLKFSYPRLKAPSFRIENETEKGLILHYRSKRKGFLHYVQGQIKKVGEMFYGQSIKIEILSNKEHSKATHVVMQLHFDNSGFDEGSINRNKRGIRNLQVNSDFFLECFPFHVIFDKNMVIRHVGQSLSNVVPHLLGQRMESTFTMNRPVMDFTYGNILTYQNITFEMTTIKEIGRKSSTLKSSRNSLLMSKAQQTTFGNKAAQFSSRMTTVKGQWSSVDDDEDMSSARLKMKGQMLHIPSWDAVIFLATPVMENLDRMFDLGVYITDLSMHDVSRDLILVGAQQSRELTQALSREQTKAKKLGDMMKRLDELKKRGDELLYSMIPSSVAAKMQAGESTLDLCQPHESVTIMFSDVPGFTEMTGKMKPIDVMGLLNQLFSKIDNLIERHKVYKVETIGDVYMVAAGAPDPNKDHAVFMTNLALDMIRCVKDIKDPTNKDNHVNIRIGMHSGPVVTGVVGLKMPRFCFFGDTVNTSSRMESHGESMKIHISVYTKQCLVGKPYRVEHRGTIPVKGKGDMKTYWLLEKTKDGTKVSPTHVTMPTLNNSQKTAAETNAALPPVTAADNKSQVAAVKTVSSSDRLPSIGEKQSQQPSYVKQQPTTQQNRLTSNAEVTPTPPLQPKPPQAKNEYKPTPPTQAKAVVKPLQHQAKSPSQTKSIANLNQTKNETLSLNSATERKETPAVISKQEEQLNKINSNLTGGVMPAPPSQPKPEVVRPVPAQVKVHHDKINEEITPASPIMNGDTEEMTSNGIANGNDIVVEKGANGYIYIKPKSRLCTIL